MIYISKGAVLQHSTKEELHVSRCGIEYTLAGELSRLWLNGRYSDAEAKTTGDEQQLQRLTDMGLVEISDETAGQGRYQLLTNCIICPAKLRPIRPVLSGQERRLWDWINQSGFRLTVSELVFLMAEQIQPTPALLGRDNWHNLIHKIYTTETIEDGILTTAMERSPACQKTVDSLLGLLRKKRILLI